MEVLSMKAEKEKFAELETMLANATITQDITDDSSTSFSSGARTPAKDHTVSASTNQHQDFLTPSPTWHHGNIQSRSRSTETMNDRRRTNHENSLGAHSCHGGAAEIVDVTARIFSSSGSNSPASSAREEAVAAAWGPGPRRRRRRGASSNATNSDDTASSYCYDQYASNRRHRRSSERGECHERAERRPEWDELIALRTQLEVARTQLKQKEVVTRSLRRQLDQRVVVDVHTHAKAEEDLVAALAKASGLQEELARNSQLLVDGALVRQQLEQRCASLTQNLRATTARANQLEAEVADTRAELVKVSGALHARRNTDVVDAERLFGEELQRVQEGASREARALRQDASGLRASLEELTKKFREACGERDAWLEEAEVHASEAGHLRETVSALRQYSESDTIDQLLGQVSHFKDRADELERLQRQKTSSEAATSFDIASEADDASHFTAGNPDPVPPSPPSSPAEKEEGTEADTQAQDNNTKAENTKAEDRIKSKTPTTGEEADVAAAVERSVAELEKLQTELVDTREALRVAGEALAEAELVAREEGARRGMAEAKVQSLQREAEASALAARQKLVARRATKSKAIENLKVAIQEEMGNELARLRHELEERRLSYKAPPGMDKACQAYATTTAALTFEQSHQEPSPGVDKSCQCPMEDTAAFADKEPGQGGLFLLAVATPRRTETNTTTLTYEGVHADEEGRTAIADSSCALEAAIADAEHIVANGVVPSDSAMVLKLEAAAKEAAAVAATTETKATAWAQAFSAAAQLVLAALASVCESIRAVELPDAGEGDENDVATKASGGLTKAVGLDDLTALLERRTDARRASSGRHIVPQAGEDVTCAMEDLRENVASAVEDIRSALIEHNAQMRSASLPTGAVVFRATTATTGAQAEDEKGGTGQYGPELSPANQGSPGLHPQGVEVENCQQRLQPDSDGVSPGEGIEAPAWDGGKGGSSRHPCPNGEGDDSERGHEERQKAEGTFVLELRREARALNEALSRAEREKEDLVRSLVRDFEQVKAMELGKLRETYEAQIRDLYSYTMAIVQEFGNGIRLTRTTGDWE